MHTGKMQTCHLLIYANVHILMCKHWHVCVCCYAIFQGVWKLRIFAFLCDSIFGNSSHTVVMCM